MVWIRAGSETGAPNAAPRRCDDPHFRFEFGNSLRKTAGVNSEKKRCGWAGSDLMIRYHDEEWGVPVHDDRIWFEFLILEGAQAGLSWEIVLRKRERYREVLDGFDPVKIARYGDAKVKQLLADPGIIRNRLKIAATIQNAKAFLAVQKEFGSFDKYIWQFTGGKPLVNKRTSLKDLPARTAESDALSKDLLKRGFKFVGSTICYAMMQATGMVNDHAVDCFRYRQLTVPSLKLKV
jgi:DNA-3-methyladenine glycosylase I